MRYFFHIFDGPKVFPDEDGNRLSSPELAIRQAKALAVELSKAGLSLSIVSGYHSGAARRTECFDR
jgi:hypothetical protein